MKMIFIEALLLFLLYDSANSQETPSQACIDVQMELNSNQACRDAVMAFNQSRLNTSLSVLEPYCAPTCRDLITRLASDCPSDENSDDSGDQFPVSTVLNLTCSRNSNNQSCFPFLLSFNLPMNCSSNDSTCTPECTITLQNFVNSAGCCYYPLLAAAGGQNVSAISGFQMCNITLPPQQPACQAIGGDNNNGDGNNDGGDATGLKAFGIGVILLVATITVSF